MVLLVVDTQELIMNSKLYHFQEFESSVKALLDAAREWSVEVIYVRHDDGPGEELTKGKPGFEIYEGFRPMQGEMVFDKLVNSPFKESGFKMIVPANTNSTFDNDFLSGEQTYKYYNEFMWKGRYAECISVDETIERMKGIVK